MLPDLVAKTAAKRVVYIKPVSPEALPRGTHTLVQSPEHIHAIHSEDGGIIALAPTRSMAFDVARAHHFSVLSVH